MILSHSLSVIGDMFPGDKSITAFLNIANSPLLLCLGLFLAIKNKPGGKSAENCSEKNPRPFHEGPPVSHKVAHSAREPDYNSMNNQSHDLKYDC